MPCAWATASSAASSIAGRTSANQAPASTATVSSERGDPAPEVLGEHRRLDERAGRGHRGRAALLGLDAEGQRAPAPFPLALRGPDAQACQRRAPGIDPDGRRLELALDPAGRVEQAQPARRLGVAPVVHGQLVGRAEASALGRLEQGDATVAHGLHVERDRRFDHLGVGSLGRDAHGEAGRPGGGRRQPRRVDLDLDLLLRVRGHRQGGRPQGRPAGRQPGRGEAVGLLLVAVVDDDEPLRRRRAERDVDVGVQERSLRRHGPARYRPRSGASRRARTVRLVESQEGLVR